MRYAAIIGAAVLAVLIVKAFGLLGLAVYVGLVALGARLLSSRASSDRSRSGDHRPTQGGSEPR
jgi:hypothetical protein